MSVLADLRIALRTLLRSPGFFASAAGVLALGIAAVVVMFGQLRTITTPPPLDRVDRVFSLSTVDVRRHDPQRRVPLRDIVDWGREQRSFEALAGTNSVTVAFRRLDSAAEPCPAGVVTGTFFPLLRVRPLLGRTLVPEDARPGAPPVVVLSEPLWRSIFGADPSAVGESVRLNGETYTVVGVAPAALDLPVGALLWVADRSDLNFAADFNGPPPRMMTIWMVPIGRLRDGVAPEAAAAELQAIQARRVAKYPEVASERPELRPLSLLWMGSDYVRLNLVLFGGVLLVLALACVNAAGMLLVRGAARAHEAAVRRALGAGRLRLSGQMLAESVVVGAAAALLALALAAGAMEALHRIVPALLIRAPSWWRMRLDVVTIAFALGTAMVAALAAGLYPAVRGSRVAVEPLLRDGQREPGLHAARLVRWLVVLEIGLSSALLTAAGLVIRSGSRLGSGDVGVPTSGFLMARILLSPRYHLGKQLEFAKRLTAGIRTIPGAESAVVSTSPPGIAPFWSSAYAPLDRSQGRFEELPTAAAVFVGPGFFEAFRIPVRGRTFLPTDTTSSSVAIVSESLAKATWPDEDPIGKMVKVAPQERWILPVQVVGVARDVRYDERLRGDGARPAILYVPILQWPASSYYLTLPNPRDTPGVVEAIRRTVRTLDPDVPVFSVRMLDEERRRNAASLILIGRMFAVFGVVALALAAAGVYGVVGYSVAQGAHEVAIRRALGAPRGRIVAAVLARSGWQLLLGLALGMALAPAVGAAVGAVWIATESGLAVYLGVAALLSATVVLSVSIPLWRALSLEPAAALRHS